MHNISYVIYYFCRNMQLSPHIGKLIEHSRERSGLTQAHLAKLVGTSQSAIARIEKGEQNLTTEMIEKLSRALNKNLVSLASEAMNFRIQGGRKLKGEVTVKTSKNAAMGLLAASLLNKSTTTLRRMPKIEEVYRIIEVLKSIGVEARWRESDLTITPPKKFLLGKMDRNAAERTRSILMFIGPLIHFFNSFTIPKAGGCSLGVRTVEPHFFALEKFGVSFRDRGADLVISRKHLRPAEVVLYESGDTTTENALLAAALIPGKTVLKFASANYMVQDVCFFLEVLGVKIEGIGTTTLTVHGVLNIDKDVVYAPSEDPTEAMFFIAAAAVTNSSLLIKRSPIEFLELELLKLEKMGFRYKRSKVYKAANGQTDLVDIQTFPSKLKALKEKIYARPYPGLNIDNLPFFAVIATQAEGTTFIHDWVYEKRAIYYTELDKLGADTLLLDPHRIYINGKTPLKGTELVCPPALRPATILLIAMLAAKGTSILRNVYSINRGYEDLVTRLNAIGAKVEVLKQ